MTDKKTRDYNNLTEAEFEEVMEEMEKSCGPLTLSDYIRICPNTLDMEKERERWFPTPCPADRKT